MQVEVKLEVGNLRVSMGVCALAGKGGADAVTGWPCSGVTVIRRVNSATRLHGSLHLSHQTLIWVLLGSYFVDVIKVHIS